MSRLLRLFAAALVVSGAAPAAALGPPAAATAIYQQRGADGGIVLTDRPSPGTVIERAWQVEPEDPAARQRAVDLRNEAQAVTERIRSRLEEQRRRADDEAMRARSAQAELEQRRAVDLSRAEDHSVETGVIYTPFVPYGWRPGHRPWQHRHEVRDARPSMPRFRGSAAPESR